MDLSNFINNDSNKQMNQDFNTADLNFEKIETVDNVANDVPDISNNEINKTREQILKDLFTSIANGSNCTETISLLARKYGTTQITENIVNIVKKFENIIGNYFITCKYNDNKGRKNPSIVKYCLFCDCPDNDQTTIEKEFDQIGMDGFFNGIEKDNVKTIKICKKHNLKVLSSIDELSEDDFAQLVQKVAEIKGVKKEEVSNGTDGKKIIGKIAQAFKNLIKEKSEAKIDTKSFQMKDANVNAVVTVANKFENANVTDIKNPKLNKVSVVSKDKVTNANVTDIKNPKLNKVSVVSKDKVTNANVKMPVNKISVKLDDETKQIESFTVTPTKVENVNLETNKTITPKINGQDINVAVEKESKFIKNISIYTKPINDFDMQEDFQISLNDLTTNFDENKIETKSSFDF